MAVGFSARCSDPTSDQSAIRLEGSLLFRKLIAPLEPLLSTHHHLVVELDGH